VGALDRPVTDFVDAIAGIVTSLAPAHAATAAHDVAADAADLVAALIDVDARHTDDELWAYLSAFAARFDTQLARATPADLRESGLLTGKRHRLEQPSTLFGVLIEADRRSGTRHAWTYYDLAMRIVHTVASLDLLPSDEELRAIDRYRTMLLGAIDAAGIARPGRTPQAPTGRGGPAPTAPSEAGPSQARPSEEGLPPERPIEELLTELDDLVGLEPVKAEVRLLTNLLQIERLREQRKLPTIDTAKHLVFTGNPGTGKTTVARILAQIYRALDLVSKGQLVETDRSGLVAGYVGQTATKVRAVVESALGGVLLIDEAHALARGGENDFGKEAIDMLVKMMEDHRDDVAVIACGYTEEMQLFIDANPGLRSRFPKVIEFPDYTDDELVQIFTKMGQKQRYEPDAGALAKVRTHLARQVRDKGFGNARLVRNLFEASVAHQASRLVAITDPTDEQLTTLRAEDIPV